MHLDSEGRTPALLSERISNMTEFTSKLNAVLTEAYHNVLLAEETKRKYSSGNFTFRDRNAVTFIMGFKNGTNISSVADYLKISRPSATMTIKKLEKHGLVERKVDPTNHRNILVKVTRKGRIYARYQLKYSEDMARALSEDLTPEEQDALYSGLCKLNQFFADSTRESEKKHK